MLDAETEDFSRAETLTHANVCCHAKALLIQALDISELVLTDCCDATRAHLRRAGIRRQTALSLSI